jgi:single-stranded-DNA-specific exonuclease
VARVLTVLAHGDADGVSSAAVVKAALAGEPEAVGGILHTPRRLKDFEAFAEGGVYIVDVAIAEEVRRAFRSYGRVVYIDHHMLSVDLPGWRWCT